MCQCQESTLASLQGELEKPFTPSSWLQAASKVVEAVSQRLVRSAGLQPVQKRLIAEASSVMEVAVKVGDEQEVGKLLRTMTELHSLALEQDERTRLMSVLNHGMQVTCFIFCVLCRQRPLKTQTSIFLIFGGVFLKIF